jgi:hypothetical protein
MEESSDGYKSTEVYKGLLSNFEQELQLTGVYVVLGEIVKWLCVSWTAGVPFRPITGAKFKARSRFGFYIKDEECGQNSKSSP